MIEVRAARPDDLDVMLAIMCEAFGLPFNAARDVFYRDPYFLIENKRVLLVDGDVMSCLTIVPVEMWIGEALVRVAGIANVCTRKTHRGQGYGGELLRQTLPVLRERGYGFSALLPYSYGFYRKLGWETAGVQHRLTIPSERVVPWGEARHCRGALPTDVGEMAALYAERSAGQTGACARDEKRWAYVMDHVKGRAVYRRERLDGYALYDRTNTADELKVRILEIVARTEQAERGLAAHLASIAGGCLLEYTARWHDVARSGLLYACEQPDGAGGSRVDVLPGVMIRAIDPLVAFTSLRPAFAGFKGELTFDCRDLLAPDGPACITLAGDGSGVEVRAARPGENPRRRLRGDVRAWSQVLPGHLSLGDALALNRVHAYSESTAALAATLFPRRAPFIPLVDHF